LLILSDVDNSLILNVFVAVLCAAFCSD